MIHAVLSALYEAGCYVDRSINWMINGDFRYTLSAWYGKHRPNCLLCRLLDKVSPGHCEETARRNGLIDREDV